MNCCQTNHGTRLIRATLLWLSSLVLTWAAGLLSGAIPWIGSNLSAIVALIFVGLPLVALRKQREESELLWPQREGQWRRILGGLGVSLVTLLFFAPGYHFLATSYVGQEAHLESGALYQPDRVLQGAPTSPRGDSVHLYSERGSIVLLWQASNNALEEVEIDSPGRLYRSNLGSRGTWTGDSQGRGWRSIRVASRGSEALTVRIHDQRPLLLGAEALPAEEHLDVTRNDGARSFSLPLSWTWLLWLALSQYLLIAFPEEFFYRGYLQPELEKAGLARRQWNILGLPLTPAIVLSSIAFAVGHLMIQPSPARLLVFFPSLLFGALRTRTGDIQCSVVYHAACNIMLHVMTLLYL